MTTRSERYLYEQDETKSRVARNQKLYDSIYEEDSYFQEVEKPSVIERTNEIDIDKVKELLKGREVYRRELKMRELNMLNSDGEAPVKKEEDEEEKSYDINAYLDKATSERNVDDYHKINPEILKRLEVEDEEEPIDEPNVEALKEMGTTELSLNMFGDLTDEKSDDESDEDEEEDESEDEEETTELVATITKTNTFFTDSVKLTEEDEDDEEEDEGSSPVVKIIMALLILIIIALVVFVIVM